MTNIFNRKSQGAGFKSGLLSAALCLLFAQTAWAENVLKDVKAATQADGKTAITLQFAEPVGDIQAFSTDNPPRIAIDLPETSNAFAQRRLQLTSGAAKSVNTVESGGRTRVVVDLAKNAQYQTQAIGNTLVLTLDPKSAAGNAVAVSAIDFKRGDNGSGRMIVRFDGANATPVMKEQGTELVVEIANAKLPAELRRQMDVAGYATPVMNIDARDMGGKTRLVLNTKGKADMMAYQTGNEYVVEVTPKASAVAAKTDLARTGAVSSGKKTSGYAGRPVTFNFQDVPVRTVLQLIADESNLNIVAADSVGGNVTLRLVNVPWDQALEIVLRAKGLDKRKDGNVIWIGPQQELASYEQAKEDARIAIETREETISEYIQINYGNAEAIARLLTENSKSGSGGASAGGASAGGAQQRGFLSPRGSVSFDPRTNTLLLIDIPKKVAEVKQLLLTLDRAVDQVMIEARIVVAQDSFARELGAKFGVNDRYGVDSTNPGVTRDSGFNVNLPLSNPAGILNFSILGANTSLDVELQALETKGRGEVISNPRVITSNQKAAVIRQGDEVGYVTTQASGTTTVPQATVEFKEVLLELKVTPTITQDGRVFLDLGVKKDEIKDFLSTPTGDVPQIQKREVSTAVLVDDGQTVVIGGVYEFKNRDDVSKVPFLGDIPFLGALFKKSSKDMEKAELLIFVTPRILKPAPRVN
ncbi:type IV pilus secretin PilQ [Arenimonas sp.]|jgi:type IV pilus assembly protein PilQ|uniref:type IV pilus secretin PilQ n=1 Tax=Arenimonas sp. TaxID=1872635 RepID=UPI0037C138C6